MTDLYLIAHKVRNEPAFDIALRFDEIPSRYEENGKVRSYMDIFNSLPDDFAIANGEEEDPPPWWIIPTSGRRAYPYHWSALSETDLAYIHAMPPDLPDHYPHALTPDAPKRNLIDLLNLRPKSAPTAPFPRRI